VTDAEPPDAASRPRRAHEDAPDDARAAGRDDVTHPTRDATPPPAAGDPARDAAAAGAGDGGTAAGSGEAGVASSSATPAPAEERPIPIGCHPFVFGVVAATIQLALTLYLMRSC
jgi:hypothetical protein